MITLKKAYDALGLEDPVVYRESAINRVYFNGPISTMQEILAERRTGKTTYRCVLACVHALNTKNHVILIARNMMQVEILKRRVRDLSKRLGKQLKVQDVYSLGYIKVKSNSLPKVLTAQMGKVILDLD